MAVQLISVKCPECGANLNIEEGREQAFCTFCGAKVLMHNDNEQIIRHIDEASVKQAETDQIVRLKQMELIEQKRADAKKAKVFKIKISFILAVVGVLMVLIGLALHNTTGESHSVFGTLALLGFFPLLAIGYIWGAKKDEDDDVYIGEKVKVPATISEYEKKSYSAIQAMFTSAGFTNVKSIPLNDLTVGVLKRPGLVESITVGGRQVTGGGKKFPKDAPVVITYHSLNR